MRYDCNGFAAARLAQGLSRVELAKRARVSSRTVARIERGVQPSPDTARRLAVALGVELKGLVEVERA